MEEKIKLLKEKLIMLTIVLGMNWIDIILLRVIDRRRLTQGSYFPLMPYVFELVIGILWLILLIYYISVLKKDDRNERERFRLLRNMIAIASFVCILQWVPGIPTILGRTAGVFFWEKYNYIVILCYLIVFLITWGIFLICFYIRKKKIKDAEVKKKKFQSIEHKAATAAVVVVLQCITWILNIYGLFVFLVYPIIILMIWIAFLIYYFSARK